MPHRRGPLLKTPAQCCAVFWSRMMVSLCRRSRTRIRDLGCCPCTSGSHSLAPTKCVMPNRSAKGIRKGVRRETSTGFFANAIPHTLDALAPAARSQGDEVIDRQALTRACVRIPNLVWSDSGIAHPDEFFDFELGVSKLPKILNI